MATVDRQSVRKEAERIKAEFDKLAADKKINSETKMLFNSMLMLINLLISIFLEKTTKKNNKNSSILQALVVIAYCTQCRTFAGLSPALLCLSGLHP